jgi:hypothetical protein
MVRGERFSMFVVDQGDGTFTVDRIEPDPEPIRRLVAPCPHCGAEITVSDWPDHVTIEPHTPVPAPEGNDDISS